MQWCYMVMEEIKGTEATQENISNVLAEGNRSFAAVYILRRFIFYGGLDCQISPTRTQRRASDQIAHNSAPRATYMRAKKQLPRN